MISIPDHRIQNLKSFQEVTRLHQVAGLYFFSVLDCLVELAYKVSHDFFRRPHLYTDLKKDPSASVDVLNTIAPTLAELHAQYGSNEKFLAKSQRDAIYFALFGKSAGYSTDEEGNFPRLRNELVNACAAFAERVFDTGVEMLRERVRTTHRPFREYLTGLLGDSVRWSKEQALSSLTEDVSYTILRNRGVTAVFGISTVPTTDWPYAFDSNGDKLVEEISRQLMGLDTAEEMDIVEKPEMYRYITREQISNIQRAALKGAEAIATIIDFNESSIDNDDLDLLITKCYTWGSALISLKAYPSSVESRPVETSREIVLNRPLLLPTLSRGHLR